MAFSSSPTLSACFSLTFLFMGSGSCSAETHAPVPRPTTTASSIAGSEQSAATLSVPRQPTAGRRGQSNIVAGAPVLPARLHLKRFVIANDVMDHEPLDSGRSVAKQPVVAFMEFENSSSNEITVQVVFEHESGRRVGFIELVIPACRPRYRTWGRTRNIDEAGLWTAIVSDDSGEELIRQPFTVAISEDQGC